MNKVTVKKIRDALLQGELLESKEDLICHSYDATGMEFLPDVVVKPRSVEEIVRVVKIAAAEGIPLVTRGSGSGFVGGSVPVHGGIVLALNCMNRILEIDEDNLMATVECGVITGYLQSQVESKGLFYPPDPSSLKISTLGGNAATCAGGPRAVKYGVTKDYVMGLEIVLPNGEVLKTGGKLTKNVAGFDLTQLFVGSEGTLGVITKLILKLLPKPESVKTMLAFFPIIDDAAQSVAAIISSKIIPCTLEFMDKAALLCVEKYTHLGINKNMEASLLIELDGDAISVNSQTEKVKRILKKYNAGEVKVAEDNLERELLWKTRRSISPALGQLKPTKVNQDISVPRNSIPEMIRKLQEIERRYELMIVNFGHAGDGNIHVNIMTDSRNTAEMKKVEKAVIDIFDAAIFLGGSISGEHGIGITKKKYLEKQIGKNGMEINRNIKSAIDPKNIMNPGKVI